MRSGLSVDIRPLPPDRLDSFIKFEWDVYRNDPVWVPHLLMERKEFLSPKKNPFFEHADVGFFMAYRGGQPVGRIAAIVNRLHNEFHEDTTGFFGLFECLNDPEAARSLLKTAADFVRERHMTTLQGPFSFSTNDECGLLIDNFGQPPQIMMTYNPSYYVQLMEENGFSKVKDLLAFRMDVPEAIPERLQRGVELIMKRNEFTVRTLNMKRFDEELERIKKIYNAAWEKNWGFVPMTDAEFDFLAKQLKQIVDPDLLFIAEHKGEPVGFSLCLPNINEVLGRIRDGRLLPFGLFKLLWYMRPGKIRSLRVLTLGIVKEHRNSGIDVVFYHKCFENGMRKGYLWGEMSWILEDNTAMNRALERMGAIAYKRYRIYQTSVTA